MNQSADSDKGLKRPEMGFRTWLQIVVGLLLVGICLFVFAYVSHDRSLAGGRRLAREHAVVIARDVGRGEVAGTRAYLELAARVYSYRSIRLFKPNGSVFFELSGPPLDGLDLYLFRAGLIPVHRFRADILFQGRKVGSIQVERYCHLLFQVVNFSIFLLLLMFFGLFVYNQVASRRFLEQRTLAGRAGVSRCQNPARNPAGISST